MKEEVLHFIWQFQRLSTETMFSTTGERIKVLAPGILNRDAGPDFSMARIKLEDREWIGHVEIHVRSSDWYAHGHQNDPAYRHVILHVVYEDDRPVTDSRGKPLPTLVLKPLLDHQFIQQWKALSQPFNNIPCEQQHAEVPNEIRESFYHRIMVERMEQKMEVIHQCSEELKGDVHEVFYRILARGFGQKKNQTGFELLARYLPMHIIRRHQNRPEVVEALVFGVAGFLDAPKDPYQEKLAEHFNFARRKYNLDPLKREVWKFARLRPGNFPTVRLAQFARFQYLIKQPINILQSGNFDTEIKVLKTIRATEYWDYRYRFGQPGRKKVKYLGEGFIRHLMVNVFIPFRFYRMEKGEINRLDWIEQQLQNLPPEKNQYISKMEEAGFRNANGYDSQVLYRLYHGYCSQQKCLNCHLGYSILKGRK